MGVEVRGRWIWGRWRSTGWEAYHLPPPTPPPSPPKPQPPLLHPPGSTLVAGPTAQALTAAAPAQAGGPGLRRPRAGRARRARAPLAPPRTGAAGPRRATASAASRRCGGTVGRTQWLPASCWGGPAARDGAHRAAVAHALTLRGLTGQGRQRLTCVGWQGKVGSALHLQCGHRPHLQGCAQQAQLGLIPLPSPFTSSPFPAGSTG